MIANAPPIFRIFALALLGSCAFYLPRGISEEPPVQEKATSVHDRVYRLQHRILPNWTHHSEGMFYEDLKKGMPEKLNEVVVDLLGEEYAKGMTLTPLEGTEGYAIGFPEPKELPECHYVIILKNQDGFDFFTLEKTLDHDDSGYITMLCKWDSNGDHLNFGPRKYKDLKNFIKDISGRAEEDAVMKTVPPKESKE